MKNLHLLFGLEDPGTFAKHAKRIAVEEWNEGLIGDQVLYDILVNNRRTGKTTRLLLKAIRLFLEDPNQFVILRTFNLKEVQRVYGLLHQMLHNGHTTCFDKIRIQVGRKDNSDMIGLTVEPGRIIQDEYQLWT